MLFNLKTRMGFCTTGKGYKFTEVPQYSHSLPSLSRHRTAKCALAQLHYHVLSDFTVDILQ